MINQNIFNRNSAIIATSVMVTMFPNVAQANETLRQINSYSQEQNQSYPQVTSVDQLRDVSPTDWAYEALRSLVERYGCIAGFPNQTYRGDQPLSRYEFAAGLNSCLNQIERLIAAQGSVTEEDLETVNRLSQEFEAELATVGGRVDELESRAAVLEDQQFSTTTKLAGEVIFAGASIVTGSNEEFLADSGDDDLDEVPVFGYRARIELETSFMGEDLLFTRLSTGNFPEFSPETGTFQGEFAFAEPAGGDLALEVLFYDFPLGDSTNILVGAAGLAADDILDTVSILDGDGGSGAITAFGTRSPIFLPPGEAGLGIIQRLGDKFKLGAGYLAAEAQDPSDEAGLFDGPYSAMGQLLFSPSDRLDIAFTYVHGVDKSDTGTGSDLANIRSLTAAGEDADLDGFGVFADGVPTVSDFYNLQFSWAISDRFVIGGWGGLTSVVTLEPFVADGELIGQGSQDIFNWAVTLAFPDLIKEGSIGGIILGMEPWVGNSSIDEEGFGEDDVTSFRVEAFYQYQLNDNIAITPGVVYVANPDNNNDNSDLVLGTIRTTFNF
ncbi:MAG: iron uptake porin [Cyanobacteria bacterium J06621_8]